MTDQRKTSEELIKEARSRLSHDHEQADRVPEARPTRSTTPYASPSPGPDRATFGGPPADDPVVHDASTWEPGPVETFPSRGPFFTSRWFRVAALLVIGLGYGFFTSLDDAGRDDSGEIVSAGDLDVMKVQPGDCFNDPGSEEEVVFQLEAIPCSEPHDNEVFAVQTVAGLLGPGYPGREALEEHAYEVCSGAVFDSYVGTPYLDSALDVFTMTPTDESWSEGDRDVVCVLYKLDFTKLTRPARDSGL